MIESGPRFHITVFLITLVLVRYIAQLSLLQTYVALKAYISLELGLNLAMIDIPVSTLLSVS